MNKKLNMILIALLAASISLTIYTLLSQKKLGYFDYNEVYNNCSLKLKLEKDLQQVAGMRKSELDSLQLELSFLSEKIKANNASSIEMSDFEDMKNRFLTFKGKYEEENIKLKETYFHQIRTEINEKSKIYGEQNGYDYLFATSGEESLMFAAESENITKEFQQFLDKK